MSGNRKNTGLLDNRVIIKGFTFYGIPEYNHCYTTRRSTLLASEKLPGESIG